jgi:hypothetical protein
MAWTWSTTLRRCTTGEPSDRWPRIAHNGRPATDCGIRITMARRSPGRSYAATDAAR